MNQKFIFIEDEKYFERAVGWADVRKPNKTKS